MNKITGKKPMKLLHPTPTIIVLNGPIDSGKDAIGEEIKNLVGPDCHVAAFKEPLYDYMKSIYNITQAQIDEWSQKGDEDPAKWQKHLPRPELDGLNFREALIHVSEDLIKPVYGDDIMGVQLGIKLRQMWPRPKLIVITDGGFDSELLGLKSTVHPHYKVIVVKLYRDGCEYGSNDSRSYFSSELLKTHKIHCHDLYNDKTIRSAARNILWYEWRLSNDPADKE